MGQKNHLEAMHHGDETVKPRSITRIASALKNCSVVFLFCIKIKMS